jgi:hypothetical protein
MCLTPNGKGAWYNYSCDIVYSPVGIVPRGYISTIIVLTAIATAYVCTYIHMYSISTSLTGTIGHWWSAVYFKRIRKRRDKCWSCAGGACMTRSHALLHCPNATLAAARVKAWDGRDPGSIRVLLSKTRWERRLLRFLELSGLGRIVEVGLDVEEAYAARMDEWVI